MTRRVPLDPETAAALGIRYHAGWVGPFTRREAPGAWRNGTRIRKCNSEPDDEVRDGTEGTVLGSIFIPEAFAFPAYFVAWDPSPRRAIFVIGLKVST